MKNTVLVNYNGNVSYDGDDAEFYSTYIKTNIIIRLLKSLLFRISPRSLILFYKKNWLYDLRNYSQIIVFDSENNHYITNKIAGLYPEKRLVLFYRNPIFSTKQLSVHPSFELWTSDYFDARKFGMKYGGQFVFENDFSDNLGGDIQYDFYFVGVDKGRFKTLFKIEGELREKYEMTTCFRYVSPLRKFLSQKYSSRINYHQVVCESKHAKVIVEYNQNGQMGLTLRAVESLFLQKKLITNNTDICNHLFYDPRNILVLNYEDSLYGVDEFIQKPFHQYADSVIFQYGFKAWLKRIIDKSEFRDRHDNK